MVRSPRSDVNSANRDFDIVLDLPSTVGPVDADSPFKVMVQALIAVGDATGRTWPVVTRTIRPRSAPAMSR